MKKEVETLKITIKDKSKIYNNGQGGVSLRTGCHYVLPVSDARVFISMGWAVEGHVDLYRRRIKNAREAAKKLTREGRRLNA